MTTADFRAEYMADLPLETREDRRALELWSWYHWTTESFDRVACAGRSERGAAIPVSYWERGACSQNAARTYLAIREQADREGIAAEAMMCAKRRADQMSFEEHERVGRFVPEEVA
jgi:hypothetical protein